MLPFVAAEAGELHRHGVRAGLHGAERELAAIARNHRPGPAGRFVGCYIIPGHLRVTVRSAEENARLFGALAAWRATLVSVAG